MTTKELQAAGLLQAPDFVLSGLQFETLAGSHAYGTDRPDSDFDIYGFTLPPVETLFPHLSGAIPDFGTQPAKFKLMERQHVMASGKEHDVYIYSIVWYFQLAMQCSPPILDTLFSPQDCVLTETAIGRLVRHNAKTFLSKKLFHSYRGFAHSQMAAIEGKRRVQDSKRAKLIEQYGYDVKYGAHAVRALLQCQQFLTEGRVDLRKYAPLYLDILEGRVTLPELKLFLKKHEEIVTATYNECDTIPDVPDETAIKGLLVRCLEMQYGDLGQIRNTALLC